MNWASSKQLARVLYGDLKLAVLEKTDSGAPSTGKWALKKLTRKYPEHKLFFDNLKRFRTLKKYKDTYCTNWIENIDKLDGRIHFPINIVGTESGRISSAIQQIPKRTEDANKVRHAIIARPGGKLVEADMSQIEARIRAHVSQDSELLRIFKKGEDIYKHTASAALNKPISDITNIDRDFGKVIDLAISYGMTAWGLKDDLNCSLDEAKIFLQRYFKKFPLFAIWQKEQILRVKKFGYTETLFGLRRKMHSDINLPVVLKKINGQWRDANSFRRAVVERQALDYVMQGSVAQLMDMISLSIQKRLSTETKLILQVHDALLFDMPESRISRAVPFIKNTMENIVKLSVPTPCQISVGDRLSKMEKYNDTN